MIYFKNGYTCDPKTRRVTGIADAIYELYGADMEQAPPVFLQVDSAASKQDVQAALKRIEVKGRKGKRRPDQALKELGAMRLFNRCGNSEAALEHTRSHGQLGAMAPRYEDPSQWWRAKSNALKRIDEVMRHLL